MSEKTKEEREVIDAAREWATGETVYKDEKTCHSELVQAVYKMVVSEFQPLKGKTLESQPALVLAAEVRRLREQLKVHDEDPLRKQMEQRKANARRMEREWAEIGFRVQAAIDMLRSL